VVNTLKTFVKCTGPCTCRITMSFLAIQFTFKDIRVCKHDRTYTCKYIVESCWYLLYRVTCLRIFNPEGLSYKVHVVEIFFICRLYVRMHACACVSNFCKNYTETERRFRSVSIVVEDWGINIWFLPRAEMPFVIHCVQTITGACPASYTMGTKSTLPWIKVAGVWSLQFTYF
jgi:hypothetical protein